VSYVGVCSLEALAGAVWLQQVFYSPELLVRMRNVIAFVLMLAGVSLAGATLATFVTRLSTGSGTFRDLQLWWVSGYLGMLLFTPLVLSALRPGALPPTFARVRAWEVPLQLLFLAAASQVAFGGSAEPTNVAEVPYIVYPVLVWIAVRAKPPQLVLVALLIVACTAVHHTSAGHGPFAYPHFSAFGTLISAQIFLVVTTVTTLLLAAAVFERRHAMIAAHASDESYRSFVRNSHDAIWRVEIDPPLPLSLAPEERGRWLWEHARIAEHNDVYARIGVTRSMLPRYWREDQQWFDACQPLLENRKWYRLHPCSASTSLVAIGLSQSFLASTMGLRIAAATPLWMVPTITSTSSLSISLRSLLTPTLGSAVSSSFTMVYLRPAISPPISLVPRVKPAKVFSPRTAKALENGSSTPILIGSSARTAAGAMAAPSAAVAVLLRKWRRFMRLLLGGGSSGDPEVPLLDVGGHNGREIRQLRILHGKKRLAACLI